MHPNQNFERIVNRKKYSVATATLIASDEYWDGHNWERNGRNAFLYRTPNGNYFKVSLSQWQDEQDTLTPISQTEAIELYEEELPEHIVEYSKAFPDVQVEAA